MKNSVKRIFTIGLSALMAFSIVGCKDDEENSVNNGGGNSSGSGDGGVVKEQIYDTETRPVVFATDALDGNFNPFFATSATDSKMAAMTQIGMLSTDANGNPVCGENEPVVVLDYKQTMKNSSGEAVTDGKLAETTEYEFIIKNGIKFSDGVELTIKDVLFNLYVYLDPAYMGSATIYSTDIVGLQAYRTQDPNVGSDVSDSELQQGFYATAEARILEIVNYLDPEVGGLGSDQIDADIATIKKLFKEEVTSDWNLHAGTQESYKDEYSFTEDWEIYYFAEGLVTEQYGNDGKVKRDENGKKITSLNTTPEYAAAIEEVRNNQNPEYSLEEYVQKEGCTMEEAAEYAVRDYAIDQVYDNYTLMEENLINIIHYWATGSKIRDEFAAEARTEYYESKKKDGKLVVETISGITTHKTTVNGEEHDVLKIVINGVDPKAIWNFAFSVSPMHYYSNAENTAKANGVTNFGVEFANKAFFDNVLQAPEKNGLPVGAGTYMATNETDSGEVTADNFYRNNWVYFERNPYFETVGAGMSNAKIKYLRYKVVGSDKIINALQAKDIDFGEPQATMYNMTQVGNSKFLNSKDYETNGYGYVGINPKYVPDIEVRQAIMKAMNTASIVTNYYTEKLASVIYRPMSITNWAYPKDSKGKPIGEYESIAFTTDKNEIKDLVESAGWMLNNNGIYQKNGKTLKIVFTIAGETTDHPAYEMFQDAAKTLNSCGFDVSVTTDISALKKLATGGLEVWAAAWSSTVDPDLYQVYHKDSKATSIKNWGYETIFADTTGQFVEEQGIINDLSEKIEEARETIIQSERKALYAEALDLIMDLAVELPTYQRRDLVVYNNEIIDASTLNQNPSANSGVYDRIWEVNYN